MSSSRGGSGGDFINGSNNNISNLSGNNSGLNNNINSRSMRDYGSTSSSSSAVITGGGTAAVPNVSFAGFSPTEFISLSESITQNINLVLSGYQSLEKAARVIGTSRDNQNYRDKIHQTQTTINNKILGTSKDLQRLTVVVRGGDSQQTLQVKKLSSNFKESVELYHNSQQKIASKMKAAVLQNQHQFNTARMNMEDDQSSSNTNDNVKLIEQEQKRIERDLKFEQSILQENEKRMQQIETDVIDINQIMRELSGFINYQGTIVDILENNIDVAANNVDEGVSQLGKATQHQAKYRKKVLILLVIAVIVGIIVAVIIVSSLK